jgi:hypothetical protein
MVGKSLDAQVVSTIVMGAVDHHLSNLPGIIPTDSPQTKEVEIVEYEGRMRVGGMEKFEAPSFISSVSFYLTGKDLEHHKSKGALILYLEFENASKLYKALGFKVPEDEDDISMMEACGKFCHLLGENIKNKLSEAGYVELFMSTPDNCKNSSMEGVEYSPDQKMKHEFSYYYWKRKAIVVELTLADIPSKK